MAVFKINDEISEVDFFDCDLEIRHKKLTDIEYNVKFNYLNLELIGQDQIDFYDFPIFKN